MNYPLSESDLEFNLQQYGVKIIDASEVHPRDFDIAETVGAVALFHRNPNSNVGHWTLLTQRSPGVYEHFDSLATNRYLGDLEDSWGVAHNHDDGRWNGCRFIKSSKPLQKSSASTCGRWLIYRVLLLRCSLRTFEKHCAQAEINDRFLTTKLTLMKAP